MDFDAVDLEKLRARRGEKWGSYPDDVLSAWVADMDFPVAEPIQRVLVRMLDVGDVGYPVNPSPGGLPAVFTERVAQRFDWSVDPQRVEVLTDVVQALYIGLEVYSEAGDGAIIQTPIYPPFLSAVQETGRRGIFNTLVQGAKGYEIDVDALRASLDARTRVFMLCNPHNPTGRAFTRQELETLAEIAIERDLVILSDEIHADLVFAGHRHIPIATLGPEVEARTVTLMSATKAFNIAGLRCAVAAFGSQALKERFNSIPRHVRGGVGTLGLEATRTAWQGGQDWLDRVLAYLEGNRDFLADFVRAELPTIHHFPPQATYLAWLDCRDCDLERGPYRFFLERARVALSDGRLFGEGGRGFVRLNFATSREILSEILGRMAKAL